MCQKHFCKYNVYIDSNVTTSTDPNIYSKIHYITSLRKHELFSVFKLQHMHVCAYQCDRPPPTPARIIKVSFTVTHSNTNSVTLAHMHPIWCMCIPQLASYSQIFALDLASSERHSDKGSVHFLPAK